MTAACPSDGDLDRLLANQLSATQEQALEGHVADCPACQRRLDALTNCDPTLPALRLVNPESGAAAAASEGRASTPRPVGSLAPMPVPLDAIPAGKSSGSAALRATGTFLRRRVWAWPHPWVTFS